MDARISEFFAALWQDYLHYTPSAKPIHALLGQGADIVNDHIALRTFNTTELGLPVLAQHFLDMGYEEGGDYFFKAKKLRAKHYQHSDPRVPKVFISELLLEEFSSDLQDSIAKLLAQMDVQRTQSADFIYSGRHWDVSHETYQKLLAESEYAGWLAAFGFRANHFTVNVNQLPGYDSVAQVNETLKAASYSLNTAGGEIKGGPEVLLAQSSTMADKVDVDFTDGRYSIPACFYEFAYRYAQADGQLYQGFVEASADKIFESTNAQ